MKKFRGTPIEEFTQEIDEGVEQALNGNVEEDLTWCHLPPKVMGAQPFDLSICEDACQVCPVNNDCIRWVDAFKQSRIKKEFNNR